LNNLDDFILFTNILKTNKLSLLSNMLLLNNWELSKFKSDWNDSRRFFVEFNDWTFWIIDSSFNMNTKSLMDISSMVWIKNAIYMDTWMYDMATYYEPKWKKHIMWHVDNDKSTNRVVISVE